MYFAKGKNQNRATAEIIACIDLKGQNTWENAMFKSLLHLNWEKKKLVEEVKNKAGSVKELLL